MANIEPCNWSVGAVEGVEKLRKVADGARDMMNKVREGLKKLEEGAEKYLSWMKYVPPAKIYIDYLFKLANFVVASINAAIQAVFDIIEHLAAPWVIRSIGNAMVDQFDTKFGTFHMNMERVNFIGAYSWKGTAGDYYRDNASQQSEHGAHATHTRVTEFAKAVQKLGDSAVSAVNSFIWSTIGGFIAIGKEASGLATAKLAAEKLFKKLSLAFAIAATVLAIIKFARAISEQSSQFLESAPKSLRPWPKGAVLL